MPHVVLCTSQLCRDTRFENDIGQLLKRSSKRSISRLRIKTVDRQKFLRVRGFNISMFMNLVPHTQLANVQKRENRVWREKEFPLLYSENIAQKRIRTTLCKIHTLMTEFPPSPHHIPLPPIQPSAGSSCVTSFIIIHFGKKNCRCEQFCFSRILSAFLYIVISTLAYSCTCIFSRKVVTAPQLRKCPHALVFR